MPTGAGILSKMGISIPATWKTAYAAVDTLIPFTSEGITEEWQRIEDMNLIGNAGQKASAQGPVIVRGPIIGELDYYNFGAIFKAAMGSEAAGVYNLTNTLQASGNILRAEFDKAVSRWRVENFKINRMIIRGRAGEAVEIEIEILARKLSQSATAFPSISLSNYTKVTFCDLGGTGHFRIGDTADVLTNGDDTAIQGFTITLDNNLVEPDFDSEDCPYALEPIRNGFRNVTLDLELPRYDADTLIDFKTNDTFLQAEFYFVAGAKTIRIQFPYGKIISGFDANIGGPEVIKPSGQLQCFRGEDNINMLIDEEMRLTLV